MSTFYDNEVLTLESRKYKRFSLVFSEVKMCHYFIRVGDRFKNTCI
jgi:hypothetical protein